MMGVGGGGRGCGRGEGVGIEEGGGGYLRNHQSLMKKNHFYHVNESL